MPATDPADLGAMEARRLIGQKALSPVELAKASIARVERVDHAVNALVAFDFDRVLADAEAAEETVMREDTLGPLHGLPVGVKDMIDVAGLPTTYGSEIYRDNQAAGDDRLVEALRRAGAIPLGKTNNPEWSAGGNTRNPVYGVTANPYDLEKTCAGSSGGSAVALACGYAPLATGSDTGGSLRNPAAYCAVTGFRPSPGIVPGDRRETALIPLPTPGPMARTVADAGLMLSVIARPDRDDPCTLLMERRTPWDAAAFSCLPRMDLSGLTFAATEDFGFAPTERIIRNQFQTVVTALSPHLGNVEERSPDCTDADRIFSVLRGLQFLGLHAELLDKHPDMVGPNVADNVREGRSYSAEDVAQALIAQSAYYRRWQAYFDTVDFLLTPAVTLSPRPWRELYPVEIDGLPTKSYYHWLALAYATTIAGHPSITIPCGFDCHGMPFGLQIVGRRYDDLRLLAVAAEIEAVIAGSDLHVARPDLEALAGAAPLSEAEGFLTLD